MNRHRRLKVCIAIALAGVPLITSVGCDPYHGFSLFRDDDAPYFADWGVLDLFHQSSYYDPCAFDCGFAYSEPVYFEEVWYEDVYFLP